MNVMVLGATGYLGKNLVYKLQEEHHGVMCVTRVASDTSNIEKLNNVLFISNKMEAIEIALKHNKIDWIINCVCNYNENGTLYGDIIESNIIFPLQVLNLAVKYGVNNFVTIGSSLPENINMYSFTKYKYGEFGKFISDNNRINFADLKVEMFYGGRFEPDNRFINSCKNKLKRNEEILLTTGLQKRDIIRVEDVVSIIARLITSNYLVGYMLLPIGSGEQHSIVEILAYMKKKMQSSSILHFGAKESRKIEPDTVADIKWYKDIGYNLQYSFFEGLADKCTVD